MIVSLVERKIHMNMTMEEIRKLSILSRGMNYKNPTWNNNRYFYRIKASWMERRTKDPARIIYARASIHLAPTSALGSLLSVALSSGLELSG
jgi:hypothetical protein